MATTKVKKVILVIATIVFADGAAANEEVWKNFKIRYTKNYTSLVDERLRYDIFKSNLKIIEEHNIKYENGQSTYYLEINKFCDLTDEEFEKYYLTYDETGDDEPLNTFKLPPDSEVPDSIDWREKGAVLAVKDQRHCGSCWAFSVTGALEGQNAIMHDIRVPLSEQALIDCAETNKGCDGGNMVRTFKFLKNFTVYTEESYPYIGVKDTCSDGIDAEIEVIDYVKVPYNEEALKEAVGTIGPVSISICSKDIKLYGGGIFNKADCNNKLNHAVLAVGYDTKDDLDYWIVKNSWGKTWGEEGYIYMARNKNQQCGISLRNSYPIIA